MNHIAGAYRKSTGWFRWFAACTCGWRDDQVKSREAAALAAHKHELAVQA